MIIFSALLASACAASRPGVAPVVKHQAPPAFDRGAAIANIARGYVGTRRTLRRDDCSGFVETVLASVGTDLKSSTRMFWEAAVRDARLVDGRPRPGDLAFFDFSYDANKNGRRDDRLTHIAIVTRVYADGRIEMTHRGGSGVTFLRAHLFRRSEHRDGSLVLNDFLAHKSYAKARPRLTGALLRGFARPPPERFTIHSPVA